jgi:hypothetical protein
MLHSVFMMRNAGLRSPENHKTMRAAKVTSGWQHHAGLSVRNEEGDWGWGGGGILMQTKTGFFPILNQLIEVISFLS